MQKKEWDKLKADRRTQRQEVQNSKKEKYQRQLVGMEQELELTKPKAIVRITKEVQPPIKAAYMQKNCALLLNLNVVVGGNFGSDLPPYVVETFDIKFPTMSFDRESFVTNAN